MSDYRRIDMFESVLSSFSDAIVIMGQGEKVKWINSAAEVLFGKSINQVVGGEMAALFPENSEVYKEARLAISQGVTLIDHDVTIPVGGEKRRSVSMSVHTVEGEEKLATIVLRDMTGLNALKHTIGLQERISEIAALAAGIAHEVKNPLGGLRAAAQLLGAESPKSAKELTRLIIDEADRINRLVTDLINLNQPGDFACAPVNIYQILDDVARLMAPEMDRKDISLRRLFDPSLPEVLGDQDRLRQIFLNLTKNAVEAVGVGGEICMKTGVAWSVPASTTPDHDGKFVLVKIIDNGPGLDESMIRHLYTPFISKKSGGSGLGLAVTLHLVRAHGGLLDVRNLEDGAGVDASVYLPYRR